MKIKGYFNKTLEKIISVTCHINFPDYDTVLIFVNTQVVSYFIE